MDERPADGYKYSFTVCMGKRGVAGRDTNVLTWGIELRLGRDTAILTWVIQV